VASATLIITTTYIQAMAIRYIKIGAQHLFRVQPIELEWIYG
jgi:hypothetical protein